jgi:DNA-binding MurR/RpiR family transcriptional regulator
MEQGPLSGRIIEAFDGLPAQLQAAARYMLDRPDDVALLSMREQARQAGVQPATMTRLAKQLGHGGYDEIRDLYAGAIRDAARGFAGKAGMQAAAQKLKGERALAAEMLRSVAAQIASMEERQSLDRLVRAAKAIAKARRIYCLGLRSSHAIAWHLHYILSLIGDKSVLLDGIGGTDGDAIGRASEDDLLIAASVAPYTKRTVELADYAAGRGVPLIAVTDSAVAPLAQRADHVLVVPTDSPSFFHTMSPAFVVAEILGALVAGLGGDAALDHLRRFDEQLAAFDIHLKPRQPASRP